MKYFPIVLEIFYLEILANILRQLSMIKYSYHIFDVLWTGVKLSTYWAITNQQNPRKSKK